MNRLAKYTITTILGLCSLIHANDYFVEARAAYFYPTDGRFKKFYSGGAIWGAELDCQIWKQLYGWVGASYFDKSGSTSIHNKTEVRMVPINLGLKGIWNSWRVWKPYLGAGASATYLQVHTHSNYLIRSNSSWGFGGIFKAGLLITPTNSFLIDLYTDYSLTKVNLDRKGGKFVLIDDADISGFSFGGALGYRF